jgi:signal transduction histidine kinase/tetratricopeptide (TPR) repeat protein
MRTAISVLRIVNRIACNGSLISRNGEVQILSISRHRKEVDDIVFIIQIMKKVLLILSLFTGAMQVAGQDSKTEQLKQQLSNHLQQDTFRVNRLNELATSSFITTAEKENFANEALTISRKTGYVTGEGYALMQLGSVQYERGNLQQSDQLYHQAESIAEKTGDKELLANVLWQIGRNLELTDSKKALEYLLKAEDAAERSGNKKLLSDCQSTTGYFYQVTLSDYAKAVDYNLKAIRSAEEANYQEGLIWGWISLGVIYSYLGDKAQALAYFQKAEDANRKFGSKSIESSLQSNIGESYRLMGKYPEAIKAYEHALQLSDKPGQTETNESNLADVYTRIDSLSLAFKYAFSSLKGAKEVEDIVGVAWINGVLSRAYLKKKMPDSAVYYAILGLEAAKNTGTIEYMRDNTEALANAYAFKKDFEKAYNYHLLYINYRDSMLNAEVKSKSAVFQYNYDLEKKQAQIISLDQQKKDQHKILIGALIMLMLIIITAILLLRNNRQKQKANEVLQKQKQEINDKAHELSVQKDVLQQSYGNVELLSEIGRKITSSLSVEKIISTAYDNVNALMDAAVFGIGIYDDDLKVIGFPATYKKGRALAFYSNSIYEENRLAVLCFKGNKEIIMDNPGDIYKLQIHDTDESETHDQTASVIYLPLKVKEKILGVLTVQSFKKNAYSDYHLFMVRNIAIYAAIAVENAEAYAELHHTVISLKKTQAQLIQSEKMAFLGELTSGIAHEIRNPLNFVNNFSEVSIGLMSEMAEEVDNGNTTEAKIIAEDIKQNLEKIAFHGKRAEAIVNGMLLHSRVSTGQKEQTDINALADECLRLSYQSPRAKNKSFNADFRTDFDHTIGKINLFPQDIARVLLNLFNNAFYAVNEKKKNADEDYKPTVTVQTKKISPLPGEDGSIEIKVIDNGNGIPQNIIDKIFQPFFTTKPTGQGTGLGLSLAYDIVKAHGGEIKVNSKNGEGSEFIVQLPIA